MLYKQYKGEDEEEKAKEDGITETRLQELLVKCEDQNELEIELTENERRQFAQFVKSNVSKEIQVWEPWWNKRREFSSMIREVE